MIMIIRLKSILQGLLTLHEPDPVLFIFFCTQVQTPVTLCSGEWLEYSGGETSTLFIAKIKRTLLLFSLLKVSRPSMQAKARSRMKKL